MLAGVLHGRRDIRVGAMPCPEAKPGQLLLRVRRAGICGSDVHYYSHGQCGAFVPTRPFILGHEFVAIVAQTCADEGEISVGDRVVVNPANSCGHCEACKSGRANLCPNTKMLGSASTIPPTDGAFAEYVAVAAHQCHRIPPTIDDDAAAMVEPLSVVLHAIRRAGGVAGARIMIAGAGPIGMITALAARAYGASVVAVSEPVESRRDVARKLGADHAFDPQASGFVDHATCVSDGGFDVVFDASGASPAVRQSMNLVHRGGTIVQIGTVSAGEIELPVNEIMVREISFLGTFRYSNEFAEAIRLMAASRLDLRALITGTYPLSELAPAMTFACESEQSLKVQLIVSD